MDDDVPHDGPDPTVRPPEPGNDLRLSSGGGGTWTVELPGGTGETTYAEVADTAPSPAWFDAPDTDG